MKSLAPKLAALFVLFVLPFVLRAWPIEHGLPRNYVPDTHIVRSALGMAQDKDLIPPPLKYSSYPNLLPYLLLPAFGAQYAAGRIAGEWADTRGYADHLLEAPADAQLVGRWLVLLFGALTPWVVFRTARAAGLGRGAWISAWLVATGLLHAQFSVHERPWVPLVFFLALAAWPAALYVVSARPRHLLFSAAAAGLSSACHQGGLPAILIPAAAWLLAGPGWRGAELPRRLKLLAQFAGVFVLLTVVLGHTYWLRYGWTDYGQSTGGEAQADQAALNVGGLRLVFGARLESVTRLSRAFFGYDPAVLLLGLGGLLLAWRLRALRPVLIFLALWTAFFLTQQSDHVRYLLPVAVLLALPAGLCAERFLDSHGSRMALGVLLLIPLVQVLRFDWLLTRADTRALGEVAVADLPADAVVAIDFQGPDVELSERALTRLAGLRLKTGSDLRARERHRLKRFQAGSVPAGEQGRDVVRLEELFEANVRWREPLRLRAGLADLGATPAEVLRALGVTQLVTVTRRPESQPSFFAPLVAGHPPRRVIDPSSSVEHPTAECFLPTEMDFPLTGLWTVSRPGPRLELHDLR